MKDAIIASHRIVHFEIPADEPEALTKFYSHLFGWTFQKAPMPNIEYWFCETRSERPGINGAVMKQDPRRPRMNHVAIASIDSTLQSATSKGNQVALPKTEVPGMGWQAAIIDPQGNICGLWENLAR